MPGVRRQFTILSSTRGISLHMLLGMAKRVPNFLTWRLISEEMSGVVSNNKGRSVGWFFEERERYCYLYCSIVDLDLERKSEVISFNPFISQGVNWGPGRLPSSRPHSLVMVRGQVLWLQRQHFLLHHTKNANDRPIYNKTIIIVAIATNPNSPPLLRDRWYCGEGKLCLLQVGGEYVCLYICKSL